MRVRSLPTLALLGLLALPWAAGAEEPFSGMASLPPGEKYRQLSILQLLLKGADVEFAQALKVAAGNPSMLDEPLAGTDIAESVNTVDRIADPQSLLRAMARLLFAGLQSNGAIESELARLRQAHPVLIAAIKRQDIEDEALFLRTAITDCMEVLKRSGSHPGSDVPELIERYQKATLVVRNDAEIAAFEREVSELTATVIDEYAGALDAMNREIDAGSDAFVVRKAAATAARLDKEGKPELEARAAQQAQSIYNTFRPMMMRTAYTW